MVEIKLRKGKKGGTWFPHLHIHDDHSVRDGCATVEAYADRVVALEGESLAITNHGQAAGFARQYFACKDRKIKPIFGMEAYINERRTQDWPGVVASLGEKVKKKVPGAAGKLAKARAFVKETFRPSKHAIILALNREGYRNLVRMSTDSWMNGYYFVPRTDTTFLEQHAGGLAYSTACIGGYIPTMARHDFSAAVVESKRLQKVFGGEFYVEIMMTEYPAQQETNMVMLELAKEIKAPLIITCDVHYENESDSLAQDVLLLARDKKTIKDKEAGEGVWQFEAKDLWWKSLEDVAACWKEHHSGYFDRADFLQAIKNTYELAARCEDIEFDTSLKLPGVFSSPEGTLREMIRSGIRKRVERGQIPASGYKVRDYIDRAKRELEVIEPKGFSEYFLILADVCRAAREMGAKMGPGRGSAGGCLIAYLCEITEIDPLRFDLLFERFMDRERPDPPDIDLDFTPEHRDSIKKYIERKYPATASIATFATFQTRAILQDVGRVFGVPFTETLAATKPLGTDGDGKSWEEILEMFPSVAQWAEKNPKAFEVAKVLRGKISHRGKSAAGVLVAPASALDELPMVRDKESKAPITAFPDSQGDGVSSAGREVTRLGFLKMDILGVRNLAIGARAADYLRRDTGINVDLDNLPLDDSKVLEVATSGKVPGVFQLDTATSIPILKCIGVDAFSDLVMATSLARPGPLLNRVHVTFRRLKRDDRWKDAIQDDLVPLLQDSRGLMILQEDVMHVAQKLCGFSLREANLLRKIVSKKHPEAMKQWEDRFIDGGVELGNDREYVEDIWKKIVTFAGYGFCKAHAVAYMLTAYQQLWMLTYHPAEYFAALLAETPRDKKAGKGDEAKLSRFMRAAMARGIGVMRPDVVSGGSEFDVKNGRITFGLRKIKGVSGAAEFIEQARPFGSLEELFEKVDRRRCNSRVIKAMILSGAMDGLPFDGKEAGIDPLENRNHLLRRYSEIRKEKGEPDSYMPMKLLNLERELLTMPLSFWTSKDVHSLRQREGLRTIVECEEEGRSRFHILAEITRCRTHKSKRGTMAFLAAADETGDVDNILIWAEQWNQWKQFLKVGKISAIRLRRKEAENQRYGKWVYHLDSRRSQDPVQSAIRLLRY